MRAFGYLLQHTLLILAFSHNGQGLPRKDSGAFVFVLICSVLMVSVLNAIAGGSVFWGAVGMLAMASIFTSATKVECGYMLSTVAVLSNMGETIVTVAVGLFMNPSTPAAFNLAVTIWASSATGVMYLRLKKAQ